MKRTRPAHGIVLLVLGMTFFGSATPVSKLVGEEFPVFTASLLRVLLGALALLPFVAREFSLQLRRIAGRDWMLISLIALFGMFGFTVLLVYGMRFISGVAGSVVMAFTPALTAAGAWLFLGAPLGWRRSVAVLLGVVGIVLMNVFREGFSAGSDAAAFQAGVGLVLAAIACEAAYTLLGKKVTEAVPPLLASFLACTLAVGPFALLAVGEFHRLQLDDVSAGGWLALLWWGVGTLGAGSAFWYAGLKRASGTTAAGFMAVMPLSALALSYLLLGEPFRPVHLAGILLVLGSVAMMSYVHWREARQYPEK